MANCYDSDSYEEDNNVQLHLLFWKKYELKNWTFSKDEQKKFNNEVISLDFDKEKLEIKQIGKYFSILYDNKPLQLKIKIFCQIIKQSKVLQETEMSK